MLLLFLSVGSRSADKDLEKGGAKKATGEELKCEKLNHTMSNGHLVCNGEDINSTCWTVCIEGYQKENELTGSLKCEENGEWNGERTTCIRKDCGPLEQVEKIRTFYSV